ncbi:NAD(P)H-quinone oxidoreductase subunit J, chloroplastic [Capsicum annuum]|uniref:NAD(P)H-quinone oxidoreductase subunit J, chloroplastic n=1 Tax=Capsicum annuum TaxID=4072 RepID=A0A2G3AJI6_CAPAN|nr:NAD(P)H-quinone oxidoreductase subunit J, chloroplastic [Capsicum annuum]
MQGRLSAWLVKHGLIHRSLGFDYQGIETLQIKPEDWHSIAVIFYVYGYNYLRSQCAYDVAPGGLLASVYHLTRIEDGVDQPEEGEQAIQQGNSEIAEAWFDQATEYWKQAIALTPAHHMYSMPPYPHLATDYSTQLSLFTHHMWIGGFLIVGVTAHATIFMIQNTHALAPGATAPGATASTSLTWRGGELVAVGGKVALLPIPLGTADFLIRQILVFVFLVMDLEEGYMSSISLGSCLLRTILDVQFNFGAHFVWAFSLMFLFSGRGYWQELIESIVWAHNKLKVAPSTQPRALSIIQGRAVGVTHYLLGGIATTWAFFLARIIAVG